MYIVANDYINNFQQRKCTCETIQHIFQDNIYINNWLLFEIAINAKHSTERCKCTITTRLHSIKRVETNTDFIRPKTSE